MPPRRLTRDPHGGLLFSQLSLEDENDDYRGHNPPSDNITEATLPQISPNEYERSPGADRSLTLDGFQTSDDRTDPPHQIQGYSESEPSALPSPGTASDFNQGDDPDVADLPDTLPLPPIPNFNGARSTPSEVDGDNLVDEFSRPSQNEEHDEHHLRKKNWHAENFMSDPISFSDTDNDNDVDFLRSEGEKSYHPSETEAVYTDSSRAKRVPKRVGKKTLAANPKVTTGNAVVQADETTDQGASKKTTHKKTRSELKNDDLPHVANAAKKLYEYRAAQAAEGDIVPVTQTEEYTHAKKSGLSSVKRVPKRSFLEGPAILKCVVQPTPKTTITTRKRAKRAVTSTAAVNKQSRAPHVDISSATQVEPKGTGSDVIDLYDIEGSPEPSAAKSSQQLKAVTIASPKTKTSPVFNHRAASSKGRDHRASTEHQPRSPEVDLFETGFSPELGKCPSPTKRKVASRRIEKKEDAEAERTSGTSSRAKKKPSCDDKEHRQVAGRDVEDKNVQQENGTLSAPDRKRGPTGPNSKKKRVYKSKTREPNSSNKPRLNEVETESGIVHFDPHTGPTRKHASIGEQEGNFERIQKPNIETDDLDGDFPMKNIQHDNDISDKDLTILAKGPRDPKQIQVKIDDLTLPVKEEQLSQLSIEAISIQNDNYSRDSSHNSPKVESNKLTEAIDGLASKPFEANASKCFMNNSAEPESRKNLTPHVYMNPLKAEIAEEIILEELRPPLEGFKDKLPNSQQLSHPNANQSRATATQRVPLAELKQPISGLDNEPQRESAVSHTTVMLHSNSRPRKVQAEDRTMIIDNKDLPSSHEQARRPRYLHHSKDDVFVSNNDDQRRPNTSFMDKIHDVQARPELESVVGIHPRSQIFAEELSKNKPFLYDTDGLGREQTLASGNIMRGNKRLELSKPLSTIHPKSQVFAHKIFRDDHSQQRDHRNEWNRQSGDFSSQNVLNQGVSDSSSASLHRQDHSGRWKHAVDIATATVQEKMHAVTQMVLRGLNPKETAISMVVKEYRRNGENIGKKLLRRQTQEREFVHDAFRNDCDQLTTIYCRASKATQHVGNKLSSISTKVSQELEDDRTRSQNLISDIRETINGLIKA